MIIYKDILRSIECLRSQSTYGRPPRRVARASMAGKGEGDKHPHIHTRTHEVHLSSKPKMSYNAFGGVLDVFLFET